jgi:uncharacterized protein YjhX (UPF0386 family)
MIKTIPSHPDYGCDVLGNVYDISGPQPRILKTSERGGDLKIGRYEGLHIKKAGTKYVHKLIAETWLSNWNPRLHVDHINRVRKDNRAENLRCLTRQENAQNSPKLGVIKKGQKFQSIVSLQGESRKQKKTCCLDEEKVWQIRVDTVDEHYKYNWINDALKDIRSDGIWMFIHKLTKYQYGLDTKYVARLLQGVSIYD